MNEITPRVKEILSYYNLNAAEFAKKLGVQKSSMSHLLSGRNKPSFDFINKLSEAFPDINIRWFITGKGDFLRINKESMQMEALSDNDLADNNELKQALPTNKNAEQNKYRKPVDTNIQAVDLTKEVPVSNHENVPNEIIVVYDDDTFKILKSR